MSEPISRIDIPSARCDVAENVVSAGPSKSPTPTNPPISPSHTSGVGRGARPVIHPSKAISIGTVATSTEASPVGIHFSEIVTPPLPQSRRQPPMMKALRQVTLVGGGAPLTRALTYIIIPAERKRAPAIRNGGIDWMAKKIPR